MLAFLLAVALSAEPEPPEGLILVSATWCRYCPPSVEHYKTLAAEGLPVHKFDYDRDPAIRRKLNTRSVPHWSVYRGGKIVRQWTGTPAIDTLRKAAKGE